jgi:2-methylisocitrate lyase-like PEP mutase family enzyme
MISARVADTFDFECLYMTGYGTVASYLGIPDAGLGSYADMVNRAGAMADVTRAPLIADADTGYGGLLNVRHTVRGYETAGVAGIQLEDQEFPKKCGHTPGRRVIPFEDAVRKVEVAVDARRDENMLIVARTDARTSLGLDEAIRRGQAFRQAGADVIFIESPETADEFRQVGQEIDAPLLANMVEGGRSPVLPADDLREMGFTIAIYPGTGFCAATEALRRSYAHMRAKGSSLGSEVPLTDLHEMHELMGFDEVWAFEKRWAED